MGEKIRIQQDRDFKLAVWGPDPRNPESGEVHPVDQLHALTPYGLMLVSLGSCTTIVVHTYAQHHDIHLEQVEITLEYKRTPEEVGYSEHIQEEIGFSGNLTSTEQEKLFQVSHQCSIHKMFENGIEIQSQMTHERSAVNG